MSEDTISKQLEGTLLGYRIVKQGAKKDGTPYKLYAYEISTAKGKRTIKGFEDPIPLVNKYLIVTYSEAPNPQHPENPYKNLVNWVEGVSKEVKEPDETYNVAPVGTAEKVEDRLSSQEYHDRMTKEIRFRGACNNAIHIIVEKQKMLGSTELDKTTGKVKETYSLDEHFKPIVKHLIKLEEELIDELEEK